MTDASPPAPRHVPQVMVSSTFTDLAQHREALIRALNQEHLHPNAMEFDNAKPSGDVIDSSLKMVRDSAGYILVIGFKYGQTPECPEKNPGGLSITELEFDEAQRLGRPVLLFIMGEDHQVKKNDVEPDPAKMAKLDAFRERAKKQTPGKALDRVYAVFDSLEEFERKLGSSIADLSKLLEGQPVPQAAEPRPRVADYDPCYPPFYVPYRPKGDQVIGRETALDQVRRQLSAGKRTSIGQAAVFQGLGGLGKTQLAVEYAYHYRDRYPNGVIWLTADQDIDAQLTDLAVKARWIVPESEHRYKLDIAKHRLRSYSDCLIVFDNLEDIAAIRDYLPEAPAEPHILATSRTEQPDFVYVPIDLLDPGQSLQLLVQEAGREPGEEAEWAAAREIADRLGGLPLALELAGAYLHRRPLGWGEYLNLLRHGLKDALPGRLSSLTRHEADLYSTLQISAQVFAEEPRLLEVLDLLTWSAAAPMAVDLMAALLQLQSHQLTGALGLGVALRLLQRTPGSDAYAIHRLVREVRREQRPLGEQADWAAELCRRIGDWFEALRREFVNLPRYEAALDHLREWHDHALSLAPLQASRLSWLQAYPSYHRGQYKEIERLIGLARSEYERTDCQDRALWAHLLSDQGYAADALGKPKLSLELAEQALAIRREIHDEKHPDVAMSMRNLAASVVNLGNPKRALALAEQSLATYRDLHGENHLDTAQALHAVADIANKLGDSRRALILAEQALAIRRELCGESHPDIVGSLHGIAYILYTLGEPRRGLESAREELALSRGIYGEKHPQTALALGDVAGAENALGNPLSAVELAGQALV